MDGSLVDANASNNAVLKGCPELIEQLREQLQGEMAKLDEPKDDRARIYYERKNKTLLNTTDPDGAIVRNRIRRFHVRLPDRYLYLSGRPDLDPPQAQEDAQSLRVRMPDGRLQSLCLAPTMHESEGGRSPNGETALQPGSGRCRSQGHTWKMEN